MAVFLPVTEAALDRSAAETCPARWLVADYRLKDHTFFRYGNDYYFAATSIRQPAENERGEYRFAYARTADFCHWESLGFVLKPGPDGTADESYLWAPHVVEEKGTYYMFYTGVNRNIAQSIMLATSDNPADPQSWEKQGVLFRPSHPDVIYPGEGEWSDARDPMVLAYGGRYYLYYTGRSEKGGIIGVAMADSLTGPWHDLGPVLQGERDTMLESPFVVSREEEFYLYYNRSGQGAEWRWGPSPFGPWQSPVPEPLGWAHDFARFDSQWYVSYVANAGDAVEARRLRWDTGVDPYRPLVGWRLHLPVTME